MKRTIIPVLTLTLLLVTPALHKLSASGATRGNQATGDVMLLGTVSVRGAQNGNIVLIVDTAVAAPPDGSPDLIIRFAPKKPRAEFENLAFDLEGARIIFDDRRVVLIDSDGHTRVSLTLEPVRRSDPGFGIYGDIGGDVPQTVRIARGYALQRQTVNRLADGTLPPVNIEQIIAVRGSKRSFKIMDDEFDLEQQHSCDAGGRGATACSYSCGSQSCSTTCGAGLYACCFCSNNIPFCQCRVS